MQKVAPEGKAKEAAAKGSKFQWLAPLKALSLFPHVIPVDDHVKCCTVFVGFDSKDGGWQKVYVPWKDMHEFGSTISDALKKVSNASRSLRKAIVELAESRIE